MNPIDGLAYDTGRKLYLVKRQAKYEFISRRAFKSWNLTSLRVDSLDLPFMGQLGFRDGTLLVDVSNGKKYLVSNSKRRLLASPEAMALVAKHKWVRASHAEILMHDKGDNID